MIPTKPINLLLILLFSCCLMANSALGNPKQPLLFQGPSQETGTKQELIYLVADNIDYDYKKRVLIYRGHVSAKQGVTLLNAEQMTVSYNKKNKIEEVIATGNLAEYKTLVNDSKDLLIATANTIFYYPINGKVRLEENAKLQYNNSTFAGPYIYYDMNKKLISSRPKNNNQCTIVLEPIKQLKTQMK